MQSIKVAVIAGIRAQFMKLAALQGAINRWNSVSSPSVHATYINTGQHYDDDLAGIFLRELDIHLDYDLTNTYSDRRPIRILGDMIVKLYDLLDEKQLDWVIVFGDANTTLAGAIAANKKGIPIVHVEAGVRTGSLESPEEANRVVTDHLSTIHFASSRRDLANLAAEGIGASAVWAGDLVGDLVTALVPTLPPSLTGYSPGEYILASLHREENVLSDETVCNVLNALEKYPRKVVFVAHPRTRARIKDLKLNDLGNIDFFHTLPYQQMLAAIKGCAFIVTDSGAFQREAYYLRKRCLIRQDTPFWESLVLAGVHRVIGKDREDIERGFRWMEETLASGTYPVVDDLGNGIAGETIIQNIVRITLAKQGYTNKSENDSD